MAALFTVVTVTNSVCGCRRGKTPFYSFEEVEKCSAELFRY